MNKIICIFCFVFLFSCNVFAEVNSDGKPVLRANFIVDGEDNIALEITGDTKHLIEFSEAVRTANNPKWREDEVQVERQISVVKQIRELGYSIVGVGGKAKVYRESGRKLQKLLDSNEWDGDFIIENPLPTTRKSK